MVHYLYMQSTLSVFFFFFFNDTATTEIYTLSLHDALPILGSNTASLAMAADDQKAKLEALDYVPEGARVIRSEEHTSELQSQSNLVCRLLLEKKKNKQTTSQLHQRPTASTRSLLYARRATP